MTRLIATTFFVFSLVTSTIHAQSPATLKPRLAVPGKIVLQNNFSQERPLNKDVWQSRQGTRWSIEEGVLRGRESSAEFQAKRKHHFGYEPRLSIPVTPAEFVVKFSFRFTGGDETAIVPFIEFGHHVCRVRFNKNGVSLLSDGETMKLAEARGFVWESGKWYHALAEMKNSEFLIQVAGGPTLYGQRESFARKPTSGGNGFGIAGPKHGVVEIDNLTISTVKATTQPNWESHKSTLPEFRAIQIKQPKVKKPKNEANN
jgi:hypothetical protein